MSNSNLIDLTVQVHHMTDRAVLISDTGETDDAVWLPLSQCEVLQRPNCMAIVTMPEWLAVERGLV